MGEVLGFLLLGTKSEKNLVIKTIKTLLLAVSLASIAFAQPSISDGGIVNAASYANNNNPNGGIGQGSMFIVFGSGLGPTTLAQVSSYPLPTTLGGTSIKVTVGGTTVNAFMIYTLAGQVAAILPANTPVGSASITLTYNGATSAPRTFNVVSSSFGTFSRNQQGTGPGIFQNVNSGTDQPVNSFVASAKPGQAIILWGTGLGPAPGNEAAGPIPGDLTSIPVEVYVGGKLATVTYRGRSGCCSGIDQIVFTVPDGLDGCNVPVAVRVGGVTSSFTTLAVSRNGGTCSSLASGSADDLAIAQRTGSFRRGSVILAATAIKVDTGIPGFGTINAKFESGSGSFIKSTLDQVLASSSAQDLSAGSCIVTPTGGASTAGDNVFGTTMDAGAVINVSGPGGAKTLKKATTGGIIAYSELFTDPAASILGGGTSYLVPGSYSVNNGSGGTDVGSFSGNLVVPPGLNWTNEASITTINRANSLTITWTGGASDSTVGISGYSAGTAKSGASFSCLAQGNPGTFTIPAWVLSALPRTLPGTLGSSNAILGVAITGVPVKFNASGLDFGALVSLSFTGKGVNYQ